MLIGPLTFSDIYIILHNVAFFVLMSVLTSKIILPQLFNLNSKKLSTFNGRNLHLITDFVMLIWNFPCKAFIVLLLLFVRPISVLLHTLNSTLYFALCTIQNIIVVLHVCCQGFSQGWKSLQSTALRIKKPASDKCIWHFAFFSSI